MRRILFAQWQICLENNSFCVWMWIPSGIHSAHLPLSGSGDRAPAETGDPSGQGDPKDIVKSVLCRDRNAGEKGRKRKIKRKALLLLFFQRWLTVQRNQRNDAFNFITSMFHKGKKAIGVSMN